MDKSVRFFLFYFFESWNFLFDSCPLQNDFFKNIDKKNSSYIFVFIPIVTFSIGILFIILFNLLYFFIGKLSSTLLCSFFIVILWDYFSYFKDTKNFSVFLFRIIPKKQIIFSNLDHSLNVNIYQIIFLSLLLIKILFTGILLFFNFESWIVVTFILSSAFQVNISENILSDFDNFNFETKFLNESILWGSSFIFCFISSISCFSVLFLLFTIFTILSISFFIKKRFNNILNSNTIGILGKFVEFFLLFLGITFLISK